MKNQDLDRMIKLLKDNKEKFIVILKEIFEENKITKDNKIILDNKLLQELFLIRHVSDKNNEGFYYTFDLSKDMNYLYERIDFSQCNFSQFTYNKLLIRDQQDLDLMADYNITLFTDRLFKKDLHYLRLKGINVVGNFDGFNVRGTNFKGVRGGCLNPKKVFNKDLTEAILEDVFIKDGDLDDCIINGTNFEGAKGGMIRLHPQKVKYKDLSSAILAGVYIEGSLDGCDINRTCFRDYQGFAELNPQNIKDKKMIGTNLSGVKITGSFDGCYIYMVNFKGSVGAKIDFEKLDIDEDWGLNCNFADVEIYNWEDGAILTHYVDIVHKKEYERSNFDGANFIYNFFTKNKIDKYKKLPQLASASFINEDEKLENDIRNVFSKEICNSQDKKLVLKK